MKYLYFFLSIFPVLIFAQAGGDLDPSFGVGGKVSTQVSAFLQDDGRSIVQQSDGKILFVGSSLNANELGDFTLIRYNPDGSLDNSFDQDGIVTASSSNQVVGLDVALQADGKIVALGWSFDPITELVTPFWMRYNTNGSLDNTFNNTGIQTFNLQVGVSDLMYDLLVQADGKIVSVGVNYGASSLLVRLNSDGSFDTSFGNGGVVSASIGIGSSFIAIEQQSDGKLLILGGNNTNPFLVRYNTDGSLDNTFSTNGICLSLPLRQTDAMVIQADGKILCAGTNYASIWLTRLFPDGSLDTNFGQSGIAEDTMVSCEWCSVRMRDICLQQDGKILVLCDTSEFTLSGIPSKYALLRYNIDGTLDNTFSSDGLLIDVFANSSISSAIDVDMQSDGKILVSGTAEYPTNKSFGLTRYFSDLNLGVIDFSHSTELGVYPNPLQAQATLTYRLAQQETLSLQLLDAQGKIVHSFWENSVQEGEQMHHLSIPANLAKGIYYLQLSSPKTALSLKVLY